MSMKRLRNFCCSPDVDSRPRCSHSPLTACVTKARSGSGIVSQSSTHGVTAVRLRAAILATRLTADLRRMVQKRAPAADQNSTPMYAARTETKFRADPEMLTKN